MQKSAENVEAVTVYFLSELLKSSVTISKRKRPGKVYIVCIISLALLLLRM